MNGLSEHTPASCAGTRAHGYYAQINHREAIPNLKIPVRARIREDVRVHGSTSERLHQG